MMKHAVLMLGALIVLAPFWFMVSYSFKSPGEIDRGEGGFFGRQELMLDERCVKLRDPNRDDVAAARTRFARQSDAEIQAALVEEAKEACSLSPVIFNYTKAFTEAPLLRYLLNGVIVTLSIFLIQIVVALPCRLCAGQAEVLGA
jgi:multiple sugar transport system permease protein